MLPANAWRIAVAGKVTWVSGDEVRDDLQRLEESLHLLLPADLY